MFWFPQRHSERNNFGDPSTKTLLFMKILPDLWQISAQLWLIFENFSSVREAATPEPLPPAPMLAPSSLYEMVVCEHLNRVLRQYKNIAVFVHFGHSNYGKKIHFF